MGFACSGTAGKDPPHAARHHLHKSWCPYCAAAKDLLRAKGVAFTEHEITGKADLRDEMVKRSGGRTTVPQIFIARPMSAAATTCTRSTRAAGSIRCWRPDGTAMIRFALQCDQGHGFESWFRDNAGYDRQAKAGFVTCPVCGSAKVEKQIMAPSVARTDRGRAPAPEAAPPAAPRRAASAGGPGADGRAAARDEGHARHAARLP